jgi:hypothetical protein
MPERLLKCTGTAQESQREHSTVMLIKSEGKYQLHNVRAGKEPIMGFGDRLSQSERRTDLEKTPG